MRPCPLEDTMGIGIAVCLLQHSLDKERYRDTLQFETVCKLRSTYSNIWHASRQTLITSVMVRYLKNTFERFVTGMHKRMEDKVHQDQEVTLVVIYKLIDGLERDFLARKREEDRKGLVDQYIFILAVSLAALRRRRVSWYWERQELILWRSENTKLSHVVLPLRERFKGETGGTFHFVVVTAKSGSGLKIGLWTERGIASQEKRSVTQGFFSPT